MTVTQDTFGMPVGMCFGFVAKCGDDAAYHAPRQLDDCLDNEHHLDLDYVAALLGHTDLVERFKQDGYFQDDNTPYRHYVNIGYFAFMQHEKDAPRVVLTAVGQSWVAKKYPPAAGQRLQ